MNQGEFIGTRRQIILVCPACSTTQETEGPIDRSGMKTRGFNLVNGAWTELCPSCEEKRTAASNAEYEALVRAARELSRVHKVGALLFRGGDPNVGPLGWITIPEDEGFDRAGERHFGFWAAPGDYSDGGFERFERTAHLIVDNLNGNRGTALLVNINLDHTQAIVHGVVK